MSAAVDVPRSKARPIIGRTRLCIRWFRFMISSLRTRDFDFVRNAFLSEVLLLRLSFADLVSRKRTVECNICGWTGRQFYPNTGPGYYERDILCPGCRGLDRHRSLLWILANRTNIFSDPVRTVEVAPMRGMQEIFTSAKNMDYVSFDISRYAMERGDITNLHYSNNSTDFFICFHVLEHIPDEKKALSEIMRILKPGGVLVMQVPVQWDLNQTYEYEKPDPREVGHVRRYGADLKMRLETHGYVITCHSIKDVGETLNLSRFGLSFEPIFFCQKPLHEDQLVSKARVN